jgi:Tfp pilus assembly PilM family ATPase
MITLLQKTGYVGIDIGTYAVKLAQIAKRGSRLCLLQSVVIPRQQPWNLQQDTTPLASTEEIVAARTLHDRFKGNLSASTMSMALCDVRRLTVQGTSHLEIESAIHDALNGVNRFQAADRTFDYWSAGESQSNDSNVNVLSTSSAWADRLARDHDSAGLRCQCIDGLPHALARACQLMNPVPYPQIALDWGFQRVTFCLVQQGQPLFVRMLRGCAFEQIASSIANEFLISLSESQTVLQKTGIAVGQSPGMDTTPNSKERQMQIELQTAVSGAIQEHLGTFAEEFQRTISFVKLQRDLPQPEQIILSGGGAMLANAATWLKSVSRLNTEIWNLPGVQPAAESPIALLGPAIAVSALALQKGGGR